MKDWINKNLFTKSGSLNNRVCQQSWWIKRNYSDILADIQQQKLFISNNFSDMSEKLYCIYHDLESIPACAVCSKPTSFINFKSGYRRVCSFACSSKDPERIAKIISNSDQAAKKESLKRTNLERYGVEYASKLFAHRSKATKLERYGDANYNNIEKQRTTNLERYGVESVTQSDNFINKAKQTRAERIPQLRDRSWLLEMNKTHTQAEIAQLLNVNASAVSYWFKHHSIESAVHVRGIKSKPQIEMYEWIKTLGVDAIMDDRNIIYPKDVDILIKSHSLAIEMNGIYWHKEKPTQHLDKHNLCKEKGFKLLQFWDSEWYLKKDICKSIIRTNLGLNKRIGARQTRVVELDNKTYRNFIESNHIQGFHPASIRLGLVHDNELVAACSFGKSRFNKNYDYELIRNCTKQGYSVVGGFSKLFNYALQNYDMKSIITYADKLLFDGAAYERAGFEWLYDSSPGFFYWHPKHGVRGRMHFQKHKLKERLDSYDESLTELENMHANNWFRVYGCGNSVWGMHV